MIVGSIEADRETNAERTNISLDTEPEIEQKNEEVFNMLTCHEYTQRNDGLYLSTALAHCQRSVHYGSQHALPQHTYLASFHTPLQHDQKSLYEQYSQQQPSLRFNEHYTTKVDPFCNSIQTPVMFRYRMAQGPLLTDGFASSDDTGGATYLKSEAESSISSLSSLSAIDLPRFDFNQLWQPLPMHVQHLQHPQTPLSTTSEEEVEGLHDEPYAQLIYKALLQAPGHRMLLRDIYEWFQINTCKPANSTTGGWQNSIRHNLSMNQAFENDKTDPVSNRGQRKANSVWILTENAIKNGVQSTTRYRKNATSKKNLNRSPALQRQRSGAKGGRAARRAARLKRLQREHDQFHYAQSDDGTTSLPSMFVPSPQDTAAVDEWSTHSYSPNTSPDEPHALPPYDLVSLPHCGYEQDASIKYEADDCINCEDDDVVRFLMQLSHDDTYGETM